MRTFRGRRTHLSERRRPLFEGGCVVIVALEGIDASGKQTQVALIKKLVAQRELFSGKVETFDFPRYESIAGALVGRVLRGETIIADERTVEESIESAKPMTALGKSWSNDKALLIQCAMLVNRFEHYALLQGYAEGLYANPEDLLILDRYSLSGIVYGQVDGLDRGWLFHVHEALPDPDLTIILDITVEESVRRRPDRADYYEKNLPKLRRVRELYLEEAGTDPVGVKVLDGTMEPNALTEEIVRYIRIAKENL